MKQGKTRAMGNRDSSRPTPNGEWLVKRRLSIALAVLAFLVLTGSPGEAQDDRTGFNLRLNATWTNPEKTNFDDGSRDVHIETTAQETYGLALGGEYRFSERFGVEVGFQEWNKSEFQIKMRDSDGGDLNDPIDSQPQDNLSFTVIDAALNIYFVTDPIDIYIGPVVGYIFYDDTLNVLVGPDSTPLSIPIDDDVAFGGVLGVDIDVDDSGWFFTSSVKYLDASFNARIRDDGTADEIRFDPWIFRLGCGYRF